MASASVKFIFLKISTNRENASIRFTLSHRIFLRFGYQISEDALLSDRFWCISPEPFELQKIVFTLLASLFEELSDRKEIFQIGAPIHLILRKTLIFQRKSQLLKKIRHFEKFKNFFSWI